jgi:hypothetical protein
VFFPPLDLYSLFVGVMFGLAIGGLGVVSVYALIRVLDEH